MYVSSYHSRLSKKLTKCMPRYSHGSQLSRPGSASAERSSRLSHGLGYNARSSRTRRYFPLAIAIGICLLAADANAAGTNGDLFNAEITKVEQLLTGGYMRIGLLGVSGAAAIGGILKQNGWMFVSGIAGCAFVYFMKNWITTTFAMVV